MHRQIGFFLLTLVLTMLAAYPNESRSETPVSAETDTLQWRAPQLIVLVATPTDTVVTFGNYRYRSVEVQKGRYPVSDVSDREWFSIQCAGFPDYELFYGPLARLYGDRSERPIFVITTVRESHEKAVRVGIEAEGRIVLVDTTQVRILRARLD